MNLSVASKYAYIEKSYSKVLAVEVTESMLMVNFGENAASQVKVTASFDAHGVLW